MNNNIVSAPETLLYIIPKSNMCHDFSENGLRTRKSVFLIPHVIRREEDSMIITWRCNWGQVCESKCHYAMTKIKNVLIDI